MATIDTTAATAPRVRYLDTWTQAGIALVVAPLILWGAVSVFMLATACGITPWVAWVPAVSTSGVMLVTTRLAMRRGLDPHIKQWATGLAVVAVAIEMVVAGLQHALPATLQPPAVVMFLIGCLPTVMGAATLKVWSAASTAQETANAVAAQAVLDARAADEQARAQTAALAEQLRLKSAADAQAREAELAQARQLAALAAQTAQAEQAKAHAARQVADALKSPPAPQRPHLVPPPKPAGGLKRDAALAWLVEQARAGRDLDSIPAAEVDRHIGAKAYARKHLKTWIADVRAYVAKGVA